MRNSKKILSGIMAAVLSGMTFVSTSCDLEQDLCDVNAEEKPATLTIMLGDGDTKSTKAQSATDDNTINKVDVFIFKNTGEASSDNQQLDTYKRFEGEEAEAISIKTTTGPKVVCVIVNSKEDAYKDVTDMSTLRAIGASLSEEDLEDFIMYGEESCQMDINTTLKINLRRLVAKIDVQSIKTKFAGTPYEGMTLSNCKLYLVNAHGDKILHSGAATSSPVILNSGKLVEEDIESMMQPALLMDDIDEAIGDEGYSSVHSFYCYSNITDDAVSSTKLVLQADLDGVTYYYSLPVNQKSFGYAEKNGHYGVDRNTRYTYGIVVNRPGSIDPNIPLVHGTLDLTLLVEDWTVTDTFIREY